jgi:hypothetical protein
VVDTGVGGQEDDDRDVDEVVLEVLDRPREVRLAGRVLGRLARRRLGDTAVRDGR